MRRTHLMACCCYRVINECCRKTRQGTATARNYRLTIIFEDACRILPVALPRRAAVVCLDSFVLLTRSCVASKGVVGHGLVCTYCIYLHAAGTCFILATSKLGSELYQAIQHLQTTVIFWYRDGNLLNLPHSTSVQGAPAIAKLIAIYGWHPF